MTIRYSHGWHDPRTLFGEGNAYATLSNIADQHTMEIELEGELVNDDEEVEPSRPESFLKKFWKRTDKT